MSEYPTLDKVSGRCRAMIDGKYSDERWQSYESSHKALTALLGGLYKAGWTCDEAIALCTDKQQPVARRLARKWGGAVVSQLQSRWRATERKHLRHSETVTEWCNVLISYWPLDGRHGAKLRVALALAVSAAEAGSLTFTASQRRIGELAGVGYASASAAHSDTHTARVALAKLEALGVVAITRPDADTAKKSPYDALTKYTLTSTEGLRERLLFELSTTYPSKALRAILWISGVDSAREVWLHPLWEHVGLGMSACRTWALLRRSSGSVSVSEIVERLRLSRSGAHKVLRALEESRLVEQQPHATWSAVARDLDDVAEALGVMRRPDYRKRGNEVQRRNRVLALHSGRSGWHAAQRVTPAPFDAQAPSVVDPFTGEIFHEATLMAAVVMLGGSVADHLTHVGRAA